MLKRLVILAVLAITISNALHAQEKKRKAYRPDIPGFFLIDFGFNNGQSKPANFSQGFWGSRTLNLYYHYPVRIGNSKFTYNPGGGFSFERFKFTNNYTLPQQAGADGTFALVNANTLNTVFTSAGFKKSMLVSNYFDLMPLEFRFDTNPKDVSRSFSVSVGGRVGLLVESHTKIKYSENGINAVYKDKQPHGLNPFRYGLYSRVGLGNFNVFWFYNFSPYFAANKGPDNTTMTTTTIGISLNGF